MLIRWRRLLHLPTESSLFFTFSRLNLPFFMPTSSSSTTAKMAESNHADKLAAWKSQLEQAQKDLQSSIMSAETATHVEHLKNTNHDNFEFSVVTYNILADCFADKLDNAELKEYRYGHVQAPYLTWAHRWKNIERDVMAMDADIVCLQEVMFSTFDSHLVPFFAANGYTGILQNDTNRMERQATANATFYKATIFTPDYTLPRSRTLLHVFRHLQHGFTIALVNGHLQGDPKRRADRVSQVTNALKKLEKQKPDCIVITGDFNDGADTTPCTSLQETSRLASAAAFVTSLQESYPSLLTPWLLVDALRNVSEPTFVSRWYTGRIDQMIVSSNLATMAVLSPMMGRSTLVEKHSLPNVLCGSDHLPAGATLRFLPSCVSVLPPPPAPDAAVVPPDVLLAWRQLLKTSPPKPVGRPDPGLMADLKAFALAKKAFLQQLPADVAEVVKKTKA
eukprot:m.127971 g.127971  ORF g.127971 m.127971 type:complete len:450 (+) comp15811_c0_seq1:49-1398(+)